MIEQMRDDVGEKDVARPQTQTSGHGATPAEAAQPPAAKKPLPDDTQAK